MILTDTHTHLYAEQFDEDREEVILKALELGIKRFFIPAIDSSYYDRMFALEKAFPENVFLMAGLHPTHVKADFKEELAIVKKQLETKQFYAIGEIGMDLYWDKSFIKEQQEAFRMQILWAKERKLPIVIHCRDAFDEIFEIMDAVCDDDLNGIFHCFTGNKEQAEKIISYGFKLGIGGVITFKNGGLDKFMSAIPLEHIVLETDSPYLAPAPYRGKRNESSYLINVLGKLVDIYGIDPEEIAKITTSNSKQVFGI
ncbi:TatD family hydrolase [Lutimonas halocynthiae]|uniref:TatD family hydrolase n=1 Tax=Lutimonas halocynthiae TaxID=1446477 RepID=UPI0025B4438B|nr:TatD family hydrolase [Lutimonas halocynthiae]MDN3643464.1 TatD family hydrolase [Lutimonas halocynthiae]